MKKIMLFGLFIALFSCAEKETELKTNASDYDQFLIADASKSYNEAIDEKEFWSARLDADTTGIGDIGSLAGAYSSLFASGGDIADLKRAEHLYKRAIEVARPGSKDTYIRGLARNYISQHRFKESKQILEELYAGPTNKRETEMQLFDAYMETGDYEKANEMLGKIKNNSDYNYLIRIAKWSDHNGDLDSAIRYLEKARDIADSRKIDESKLWIYSNIADFYGHAGRLDEAYEHYLKTLKIQPDNAYAKKGIAWILYSKEKNTQEANRILDTVIKHHDIPDYYLIKAEMAEFDGKTEEAKKYTDIFLEKANNPNYGGMYNTYKIEALVESDPKKALELAKTEVGNRATPETYQLLAFAQLKNGMDKEALETIEMHVEGKTEEPMALLHSAMVYKANGMNDKVKPIKIELEGAAFELGPVLSKLVYEL